MLPDIVLYNKYERLVISWLLPDIVLYNKYETLVKSWLLPDIVLYNKYETLVTPWLLLYNKFNSSIEYAAVKVEVLCTDSRGC